jgi:glycosyltransferase involved in cell wall biosynthesis
MVAIHQFLSSLAPRDAQSQHHLHVRDALRAAGYESDLYVGEAKGSLRSESQPFREFRGGVDAWMLYGHAIGSPVADFVLQRPEPLLLDYHNITPAALFAAWEPHAAIRMAAGRRQLRALAVQSRLALADSAFNAAELVELGARRTAVVPIMLDARNFAVRPDPATLDRLRSDSSAGAKHLLFVGRVAPNKCQHELVAALEALRRVHGLDARLYLVGTSSSDRYERTLRSYIDALGLSRVVHLVGSVSPAVLAAHYQAADVFVCLSDHEGFCVPLLEAWYHDVPIVAFAATAVEETMASAGIALRRKSPSRVAAAIARVVSDDALAADLACRGRGRLADFDLTRSKARLLDAIESVINPGINSGINDPTLDRSVVV